MSRKIGSFAALTAVLLLGLPLRGESAAALASQVQADVDALSSQPTLAAWQRSHPGGKVDFAHYGTERDPYDVDFTRLNRWCAASVANLQSQAVRAALFYEPSVAPGALPPLPAREDVAATRACRIQAIWYETRSGASIDAVIRELSAFWGKPSGQTTTIDIAGSSLWKGVVAWHRNGMNIWVAYDPEGKTARPVGPRLIVYARRDIPLDSADLTVGYSVSQSGTISLMLQVRWQNRIRR